MFTVTLDACVLVPITLADYILRAAQEQIFSVRWSPKILEETKHAMMRLGVEDQAASRRIGHMQCAFPFASTDITSAHRPPMTHDEKDWHVAAAALAADSHTIVTFNLKDFEPEHLNPLGLHAIHPDDFLLDQLDLAPGRMMRALTAQSAATRNPHRSVDEILGTLGRIGVPRFADEARRHLT